ncbi:hypothetical protein ACS0TY_021004 [Phlomoides rotata]
MCLFAIPAAINPGNSGGPFLDISRNLIGINTAIYSPSGASCGVDPQSLFEEKESLEEKVVVREYELHLALEDIFNLKAELLKKTETNLDESKGINPSTYYLESPAVRLSMFILGCNLSELNCKILGGKPLYVTLALRMEDRRARLQGVDCKAVPETLSSFGNISCEVATNASGQSMGCGFVQFSGEESAEKVINVHNGNGVSLNDKQVCEGTSLIKQEKELSLHKANFTNVFVKNFCESTTEDGLKHIFGEFGEISSTMVMRNEDGTSKCSGFVCFKNTEDAARAVEYLDGQKFGNKKWHVRRAHQQFERQLE